MEINKGDLSACMKDLPQVQACSHLYPPGESDTLSRVQQTVSPQEDAVSTIYQITEKVVEHSKHKASFNYFNTTGV